MISPSKSMLYVLQWCSQPKNWGEQKIGGGKMFDFWRITLFCLEKRFSKHKMTIFSKRWGEWPLSIPSGYAYGSKAANFLK